MGLRLEQEPPIQGESAPLIRWARVVARLFNSLADTVDRLLLLVDTGPAFRASLSVDQAVTSGVATPLIFDVEEYDLGSRYNAAGGAFQPDVKGLFTVGATVHGQVASGTISDFRIQIWRNGAFYEQLTLAVWGVSNVVGFSGSTQISLNGSTDYIQLYTAITGTTPKVLAGVTLSRFSAALVRRT